MPEVTTPTQPEFYFSERAFNEARAAGATALTVEVEELEALIAFLNDHSQRPALPAPAETTYVAMHPSKNPFRSEKHLYRQPNLFPLISSTQLGNGKPPETSATKGGLDDDERHVFEFRPWNYQGSMTGWLARRGLGPSADDAKLFASSEAWMRQFNGLSTADATALEKEALHRFPGAVRLENRPPKRTVG